MLSSGSALAVLLVRLAARAAVQSINSMISLYGHGFVLCNPKMPHHDDTPALPWIQADEPLPPVTQAWGFASAAPGLLAAGQDLTAARLLEAYGQGIFPWFSPGQPVLWWSPDPRMVLTTREFRFRRSLRQSLKRNLLSPDFQLCFNQDFSQVIRRCACAPRSGQTATWIVPDMVHAYENLHSLGHAHSAEVWRDGQLVAGLYFIALGHAVFGESMFTTIDDGSKMALACLVSVCLKHGIKAIDCQQNTRHLASLGAREMPRAQFIEGLEHARSKATVDWAGQSLYLDAFTPLDRSE
jgi:leucyl/phenylalanyl-tRNA--protein transferase